MVRFYLAFIFATLSFADSVPPQVESSIAIIRGSDHCRMESGFGLYAFGEFLWWDMSEDGFELGIETRALANVMSGIVGEISRIQPGYEPGVRAGLGFHIPYDEWNLFARWTYMQNRQSQNLAINSSDPTFLSFWLETLGIPQVNGTVSGHLNVYFNGLEVALNRWICATAALQIAPNFGFKALWFRDRVTVKHHDVFLNENQQLINLIKTSYFNRMNGYGGFGAIETKWLIGGGFSLLLRLSASLLYAQYRLTNKELVDNQTLRSDITEFIKNMLPTMELFGGLNWSYAFNDDYYISVWAGWEHQQMFHILKRNRFTGEYVQALIPISQNLGFWGFSGGLEFGF